MSKALLAALAVTTAAAPTTAAVQWSNNGTPIFIKPVGFAQGYPANSFIIEHSVSASFGSVTIWCTNNESLGHIICNNSSVGQLLLVQIGLGDDAPNSWPNNVQSIEVQDTTFPGFRPVIVANMNTNGDLGTTAVHRILDSTIRGDVTGNMIFPLPIAGINTAGNPHAIENVTIEGDMLGSIEVEQQNISNLTVKGAFGSQGNPKHIFLDDTRWIINSRFSEFHADISTPTGEPVYAVDDFTVTTQFGGTGAFTGDIRAGRVDVYPNEPGHIDFQGPMDGIFRLAIGLYPGFGSMALPGAQQFSGQVVINDTDTQPFWTGPITIGGIPITKGYTTTPDLLGGGSIGVVPFDLHQEACSPTPNQTFAATSAPPTFTLRHYGPVTFAGISPVVVESKPINCGEFTPIAQPVTASAHPTDPNALLIQSGPWLENGYQYRITPNNAGFEKLSSIALAAPSPPNVANYTYEFTLDCPGDIDNSGLVDVNDISYVLFRLGQTGCDADGDIDRSQTVDVNDISFVLFRLGDSCSKYPPTN